MACDGERVKHELTGNILPVSLSLHEYETIKNGHLNIYYGVPPLDSYLVDKHVQQSQNMHLHSPQPWDKI